MDAATPPFRAEHIGSLLRPQELLEARRAHRDGGLSDEELRAVEDRAIEDAIRLQEEVGLQAITDGEFRRAIYFGHFASAVSGFEDMEAEIAFTDESGGRMKYVTSVVTGKLARTRSIVGDDFDFVRARTSRTPKVTLPSPSAQHYFRYREGVSDRAYPDLDEFFADLASVYREELADLHGRGATYVQLDDVAFAMLCDPVRREETRERGHDPDALLDRYIGVTNDALRSRPQGLVVGMHICRGNNRGKWLGEGGYDYVAERIFGRLDLDAFFLEYDSPRAGSFEPLRFVPERTVVVLGLVSTKTGALESKDELLRRIEEASAYVPTEQLALSPQCGFASVEAGNPITPDEQRRKLELVVDVAASVWG
jgi:5-methyltetrahydropteroyltriglutamate--homocysteine methyltransferase